MIESCNARHNVRDLRSGTILDLLASDGGSLLVVRSTEALTRISVACVDTGRTCRHETVCQRREHNSDKHADRIIARCQLSPMELDSVSLCMKFSPTLSEDRNYRSPQQDL